MKPFANIGATPVSANSYLITGASMLTNYVTIALTVVIAVVSSFAISYALTANSTNNAQDVKLLALQTQLNSDVAALHLVDQNTAIVVNALVVEVNAHNESITEIFSELAVINALLNISASNNLQAQINQEAATRAAKDMILMGNVSDERAARMAEDAILATQIAMEQTARVANDTYTLQQLGSFIKTINLQSADTMTQNLNITGAGGIFVGGSGSIITIANTGVRQANGQFPDGAGQLLFAGASGIGITIGPAANQLTVNGSVIEVSLHNVDMTVMSNTAQIANLTMQVTAIQNEIAAIQMAEMILNGTGMTINASLTQIIANDAMQNAAIAQLQAQLANLTAVALPIGALVAWGGASNMIPSGYLLCDGSVLSQTTYAALYAVLGCAYCPGMTCTMGNFCLPDLRGRVPVGQLVADTNFGLRGQMSGEAAHTITTGEMPSHSHTITVTDPGHQHTVPISIPLSTQQLTYSGIGTTSVFGPSCTNSPLYDQGTLGSCPAINAFCSNPAPDGSGHCFNNNPATQFVHNYATTVGSTGATASASSAGSGAPMNVVQPSVTVGGYIIKHN